MHFNCHEKLKDIPKLLALIDDYCEKCLKDDTELITIVGLAAHIGCHKATIWNWTKIFDPKKAFKKELCTCKASPFEGKTFRKHSKKKKAGRPKKHPTDRPKGLCEHCEAVFDGKLVYDSIKLALTKGERQLSRKIYNSKTSTQGLAFLGRVKYGWQEPQSIKHEHTGGVNLVINTGVPKPRGNAKHS